MYLPNAVTSYTPFSKYLTCSFSDLELGRFMVIQGAITVPTESPLVVSYLTSFEFNINSLTIFEIFDIKDIFSIGED